MTYLVKQCKVIQDSSSHHHKVVDILIQKGKIVQIAKKINHEKVEIIEGESLHISSGWMDIGVTLGEPGHEQRETIASLCEAAKKGGYTDIAVFPKAIPTIQTRAQVAQLISEGRRYGVNIHPIAAISKELKGKEITEFHELNEAGCVAFSDGNQPVDKAGLLLRALQYSKAFDGVLIHRPVVESLANGSQIHEGDMSIAMGMKGTPSMAEVMMVERDIQLLEYTESALCLHNISTKQSVDIIKKAKKNKSGKLYASVAAMNLVENEAAMQGFDVNYKVDPPLRSKSDQNALVKAVNSDVINYISSNHIPLEEEHKKLEFPYADHGSIGLQTTFSLLNTELEDKVHLDKLIEKLTSGPRSVLGLEEPIIEEGKSGSFTIFSTEEAWDYDLSNNASISKNSPYIGRSFKGKAILTIAG